MCCPTTPAGVKRLANAICSLEILVFLMNVTVFGLGVSVYAADPSFILQRLSDVFKIAGIVCWIVLSVTISGSVGSAFWFQPHKRVVTACTTAALVCSVLAMVPVDLMIVLSGDPIDAARALRANKALRGLRFLRLFAIVPAICGIFVRWKVAKATKAATQDPKTLEA